MARRKKKSISGSKPDQGWLVTFGDLLTLLITFFVLLISMSSMDQKKLKNAFGFFSGALGNLESGKGKSGQGGQVIPGTVAPMAQTGRATRDRTSTEPKGLALRINRLQTMSDKLVARLREMRKDTSKGMHPIDENLLDLVNGAQSVKIVQEGGKTEVSLHLGMVFQPGKPIVRKAARPLVLEAGNLTAGQLKLARLVVPVGEHGLTSATFPRWELAAWRSAALIRLLKPRTSVPAGVAATKKLKYMKLYFVPVDAPAAQQTAPGAAAADTTAGTTESNPAP